MCIFLYSKLYIFKQNHSFILKKSYLVCTTLILMDSNIIKMQLITQKQQSHHKCTKMACVFKQITFISTSPSTLEIQLFKHINKNHNMIFIKMKSFITTRYIL